MNVGNLLISLGIQTDRRSFRAAEGAIGSMRRSMIGFATYFGAKTLGKALIGFNANIENTKNSIAGIFAVTRETSFASQLENANELYDGLRKKAAELPGETQAYVDMLKMIAQPMARANLSNQEMIDMTTGAMTLSENFSEGWQKSARDIREFINFGKMGAVDTFNRLMFQDYDTPERKKELKAMTVTERAKLYQARLTSKRVKEIQDAQAKSFTGRLDKVKDTFKQTLGLVGKGLTEALKPALERLSNWLTKNKEEIDAAAVSVGKGIVKIFEAGVAIVEWISEHGDVVKAFLRAIIILFGVLTARAVLAWLAIAWPFIAAAAAIAGLIEIFYKLKDLFGETAAIFGTLFLVAGVLKYTGLIGKLTKAMWGLRTASVAAAAAGGLGGGAGGALGGVGGGALNRQMALQGGVAAGQQMFTGWGAGGYNFAQDQKQARFAKLKNIGGQAANLVPTIALALMAKEVVKGLIPQDDSFASKVANYALDGGVLSTYIDYMVKKPLEHIANAFTGEYEAGGFLDGVFGGGTEMSSKTWAQKANASKVITNTTINVNTPTTNNFAGVMSPEQLAAQMVAAGKAIQDAAYAKAQHALAGNKKGKRR